MRPKRKYNAALVIFFAFFLAPLGYSVEHVSEDETGHEHAKVFTPEEEERFLQQSFLEFENELFNFRFTQTTWRECDDYVTGNYNGYGCSNRRMISEILKEFMEVHLTKCVANTFEQFDGSLMKSVHIIHDGILGDRRHSPRSLHAENRAIDVHAFVVTREDDTVRKLIYKNKANRPFYTALRKCWGQAVHENNECPLIRGEAMLTGSIGWEDRNHQNHMHTSVPYCVRGKYGNGYFRR